MTAATVSTKGRSSFPSVEYRKLVFAASGDTYAYTGPIKSYMHSLYSTGVLGTCDSVEISESSGTLTCTWAGSTTGITVNLWIVGN